ncbi:MAG: NAD-dependent epimerase/dehydratase family protein [Sphingomonadaceae bacterium]
MRILLTGGNGFMGSWVARRLIGRGLTVRVFATREDRSPLEAIMGAGAGKAEWYVGDVSNTAHVEEAARGCDAIIHIAAMLGPASAADPLRCMAVNLGGTLNMFEVAKRQGIGRVIYTSSAAVFGPVDGAHPHPSSHYGAFKLAEEGSARAYFDADGLPSIGLRPFVVYGPGREKGLSAGPSFACRAAALGESYVMPFSGRTNFVYVDDCASAYEEALFADPRKAEIFNLAGDATTVEHFLNEVRRIVPDARLGAEGAALPFAPDLAPDGRDALLPNVQRTSLADGIAATIDYYRMGALR